MSWRAVPRRMSRAAQLPSPSTPTSHERPKPGVDDHDVRRIASPQPLQNRASASFFVPHDAHTRSRLRDHAAPSPRRCSISLLDLLAVARAGVELTHQPRRPGAQARRHLGEVLLRDLPHRAIEFELLDRPQHQGFVALERRTRAAAEHLRAVRPRPSTSAAAPCAAPQCRQRQPQRRSDSGG